MHKSVDVVWQCSVAPGGELEGQECTAQARRVQRGAERSEGRVSGYALGFRECIDAGTHKVSRVTKCSACQSVPLLPCLPCCSS